MRQNRNATTAAPRANVFIMVFICLVCDAVYQDFTPATACVYVREYQSGSLSHRMGEGQGEGLISIASMLPAPG